MLVVDSTCGVEAQMVSNASLAMNANLDIVPAINKHRPAERPSRRGEGRNRGGPRDSRRRRRVRLGQDGRGHPRPARVHRLPHLAAHRRLRRPAQGPHPRLTGRVPWRGGHSARVRRPHRQGRHPAHDARWRGLRRRRGRQASRRGPWTSWAWARSAGRHGPRDPGGRARATPSPMPTTPLRAAAGLSRGQAHGLHGPLPGRQQGVRESA